MDHEKPETSGPVKRAAISVYFELDDKTLIDVASRATGLAISTLVSQLVHHWLSAHRETLIKADLALKRVAKDLETGPLGIPGPDALGS